jgi:nuclear pore complex protein Nup205
MDNPEALRKYYELLLSVIRVIVSAVFARGTQNEQMMDQTRAFLSENRQSMVGLFKRHAKIGGPAAAGTQELLHDLVKSFVALISAAGFVEVCLTYSFMHLRVDEGPS